MSVFIPTAFNGAARLLSNAESGYLHVSKGVAEAMASAFDAVFPEFEKLIRPL